MRMSRSTSNTWTPVNGRSASAMRHTPRGCRSGRCMTRQANECTCKGGLMADLADFEALVPADHGLVVMTVLGPDGRMRPSVVNVGVMGHPITGNRVVAVVIHGQARKLGHGRGRPRASVSLRAGRRGAAGEGPAQ